MIYYLRSGSKWWKFLLFSQTEKNYDQYWDLWWTLSTQHWGNEIKSEGTSVDGSAIGIIFLRDKYAGAVVLTCYGIPTG